MAATTGTRKLSSRSIARLPRPRHLRRIGGRPDALEHVDVGAGEEAVGLARGEDDSLHVVVVLELVEQPARSPPRRCLERVHRLARDIHASPRPRRRDASPATAPRALPIRCRSSSLPSRRLQYHRRPEPAGCARRAQRQLAAPSLELAQRLGDLPRAGRREGVADGDRAAVDVELLPVDVADLLAPAELLLRERYRSRRPGCCSGPAPRRPRACRSGRGPRA